MSVEKTTVKLSLPNHPDVQKLSQMYDNLSKMYERSEKLNQLLRRNVGGVIFDQAFYDLLTATFPSDSTLVTDARHFVQYTLDAGMRDLAVATELRHDASVSGAMRWPWSQEAKLHPEEMRYM